MNNLSKKRPLKPPAKTVIEESDSDQYQSDSSNDENESNDEDDDNNSDNRESGDDNESEEESLDESEDDNEDEIENNNNNNYSNEDSESDINYNRKDLIETTGRLQKTNKKFIIKDEDDQDEEIIAKSDTFKDLGLSDWICSSTSAMGFRRPTPIQSACIPAIMQGRDVMGCAETGSGKTAAFALPILNHLSMDPYGIFAVILTPTRELAIQISEQFGALGSPVGLRMCLIIGGVNMTNQSLALGRRPHIVIATPGRLRHHLEGPDPPNLSKAIYLVLDEADRLLSSGFGSELRAIISKMHKNRKTLLFSATLTESLSELEKMTLSNTLRFDLTLTQKIPSRLQQQYLFMPAQVKMCFLTAVLQGIIAAQNNDDDDNIGSGISQQLQSILGDGKISGKPQYKKKKSHGKKRHKNNDDDEFSIKTQMKSKSSMIIFLGTCRRCQEISEILLQLGFDCVALHSMMSQERRAASLGKFKSNVCRILVATDVASRGLDIPAVDLVINLDLPKIAADYVHRVGRTARAGRGGRSLSFITQYDVELIQSIETFVGSKMTLSEEVVDDDVVKFLNPVSKAMRIAQLKMMEMGFDEQAEKFTKRRRKQRKQLIRNNFRNSKNENNDVDNNNSEL
jgi:ATP-dependent RNA helicase DDX49/DBP8